MTGGGLTLKLDIREHNGESVRSADDADFLSVEHVLLHEIAKTYPVPGHMAAQLDVVGDRHPFIADSDLYLQRG